MVEEVGLQYDDCQVLEYQPDNQWTTVGQLETARAYHAVLSIGSEALPCLQGCLEQDDLFVESQYYHQDYHTTNFFIIIILLVRICHYMPLLYGKKTVINNY